MNLNDFSPYIYASVCTYYEHLFKLKIQQIQIQKTTNNRYKHTNIYQGFRYIYILMTFLLFLHTTNMTNNHVCKIAQSIKNILTKERHIYIYHPNGALLATGRTVS